jgi:hypothetical protein
MLEPAPSERPHVSEAKNKSVFIYPTLDTKTSPKSEEASRGRLCLFKGCTTRFVPRPQDWWRAKYCPDCRGKAKKWRDWHCRQTPEGKKATQERNRRFREARPDYHREYRKRNLERVRTIERESKRRSRSKKPDVHKVRPLMPVPCSRPGCYEVVLVVASLAKVRRYCGAACARAMHRFSNLLNQLRRRRTPEGNYRRKCSRPRNERRPIDKQPSSFPSVGSSKLQEPTVFDRKEPRNRGPPAIAARGRENE